MKENIGFVGLGKLGLPVAMAINSRGYYVSGYDINPAVSDYISDKKIPYQEEHMDELFKDHTVDFKSMEEVVNNSDIVFVPVQTPHDPLYEGTTRIPDTRVDFNYESLVAAIKAISEIVDQSGKDKIVVIISTVLPGTIEKYIKPVLSKNIKLCYNPFFIAMGTTIKDFLNPEFILLGVDDEDAANKVISFYSNIHNKRVFKTTVKNAELIKVSYNTFIGMKIVYANTLMEICHKTGCDVDQVIDAISLADERLISPKYLRGGMGDGGGCHPRDNIAMSWLAKKLDLSHDFFDDLMAAREDQTEWLADLCLSYNLPVVILGKSFKPETNIQTGSPSILLYNILKEKIEVDIFDPIADGEEIYRKEISEKINPENSYVYFVGTQHRVFNDFEFNSNSVVIDPFRYIQETEYHRENNIKIVNIGKGL
jgi:UDPglucose 6-dehydrogenase